MSAERHGYGFVEGFSRTPRARVCVGCYRPEDVYLGGVHSELPCARCGVAPCLGAVVMVGPAPREAPRSEGAQTRNAEDAATVEPGDGQDLPSSGERSRSMANDHYISRFLTKPWEFGARELLVHDFKTGEFRRLSSRRLFARPGLHSATTGTLLDQMIEAPVSDYRARVLRDDAGADLVDPHDWRVYRGLASLYLLHITRYRDAVAPGTGGIALDRLVGEDERRFDELAAFVSKELRLVGVTVPSAERLFFPENGYLVVPMLGEPPVVAMPLSPRHFLALLEPSHTKEQLLERVRTPSLMTTLSVGVSARVRRSVSPPDYAPQVERDPQACAAWLRSCRAGARYILRLFATANARSGFGHVAVLAQ